LINELDTVANELADPYGLFVINEKGIGCHQNVRFNLLKNAANQGHPQALSRMIEAYFQGDTFLGVASDKKKVKFYAEKLSKLGCVMRMREIEKNILANPESSSSKSDKEKIGLYAKLAASKEYVEVEAWLNWPSAVLELTEGLPDLLKTGKKIEEEYSGLIAKYFIYPAEERLRALERARLCYQIAADYGDEEAEIRGLAMDRPINNNNSMEIAPPPVTPPKPFAAHEEL